MPFYEYECQACKYYTEVMQKLADAPLVRCPSCGKRRLKKLVSAPVFRLKGGGWYETDFKSDKEDKRNLAGADRDKEKKEESKSDAKAGTEAKTEAKTGDKTEKTEAKTQGKSSPERDAARGPKPDRDAPAGGAVPGMAARRGMARGVRAAARARPGRGRIARRGRR